jgi:hypothetical protein
MRVVCVEQWACVEGNEVECDSAFRQWFEAPARPEAGIFHR